MPRYRIRSKSERAERKPLDLGISELVAESGVSMQDRAENKAAVSPYQALAKEERWSELSRYAEEQLNSLRRSESPLEHCVAEYWWITAQLKLRSMPLAILVAPLGALAQNYSALAKKEIGTASLNQERINGLLSQAEAALRESGEISLADSLRQLGKDESKAEANVVNGRSFEVVSPASRGLFRKIWLVWLTALVAVGWGLLEASRNTLNSKAGSSLELIAPQATASLKLPQSEQAKIPGELDAIVYDMDRSFSEKKPQAPLEPTISQTPSKEKINTSSPLEQSRKEPERAPSSHAPPLSSDALVVSPSFEEFGSAGRIYTVLVSTQIMPAASTRGRPLDLLMVGERVVAEGREGYWLRIRSQRGRVGYILAQDATEYR